MQNNLDIIVDNEISLAFLKANAALLDKYNINSTDSLIEHWKKEYNADIVLPSHLIFKSKSSLTLFLLRWS
jgi:hypothetical protein